MVNAPRAPREPATLPALSGMDLVVAAALAGVAAMAVYVFGTDSHAWGDDWALYLLQAQALADGDLAAEIARGSLINSLSDVAVGPPAAPWGFPAMLWLASKLVGLDVNRLKVVAIICNGVFAAGVFILARGYLRRPGSVAVATLVALQPRVIAYGDTLGSDIPSLATIVIALAVAEGFSRPPVAGPRIGRVALLALLTLAAFAVRSNGAFVVMSGIALLAVGLLSGDRSTRRTLVVEGALLTLLTAAVIAVYMRFVPDGSMAQLDVLTTAPDVLVRRIGELAASMSELVPFSVLRRLGLLNSVSALLLGGSLAALTALGTWRHRAGSAGLVLFALLNVGLLIIFPANAGIRYLFPILAPLVILATAGLVELARLGAPLATRVGASPPGRVAGMLASSAVVVVMAMTLALYFREPPAYVGHGPFTPPADSMFTFIRTSTQSSDVVSFFKPRALRYLTGRIGITTTVPEHLDRADYVVLLRDPVGTIPPVWQLDQQTIEAFDGGRFASVFENSKYTVYQARTSK